MKKSITNFLISLFLLTAAGCAPAVIAGGAAGTYKVATEERSVGRIWDDAAITARINTELVKDPSVKARKIDVDTIDGIVTLSGVVETKQEAVRSVEIARNVQGVKKVTNNIQIGSKTIGQSLDDKMIGNKIKFRLMGEPGVRSLNIDVDVDRGVVTLTGMVDNSKTKNRIIQIAEETPGTVKVIDNMKLR